MKLLTHNFLSSRLLKGVSNGYPLKLEVTSVEQTEVPFDEDTIKRLLCRVDYDALYIAAEACKLAGDLPKTLPENARTDIEFLKKLHAILNGTNVLEGSLICPETGRVFPIKMGIPNMTVNEDECANS
uniref:Multifunctional methyltransferase subunit TRM112-like protein n=1 Tax=Rhabditophanes sp. KR3021 TaxID=114890 RepID=A0AC35TQE7_9BILA